MTRNKSLKLSVFSVFTVSRPQQDSQTGTSGPLHYHCGRQVRPTRSPCCTPGPVDRCRRRWPRSLPRPPQSTAAEYAVSGCGQYLLKIFQRTTPQPQVSSLTTVGTPPSSEDETVIEDISPGETIPLAGDVHVSVYIRVLIYYIETIRRKPNDFICKQVSSVVYC